MARTAHIACGLALLGALSSSVRAEDPPPPKLISHYLQVDGVKSGTQAIMVAKTVRKVKGVQSFRWIRTRAEAHVVRTERTGPAGDLVQAVERAGFKSRMVPVVEQRFLFKKPLRCNGCAKKVYVAFRRVKGMKQVVVAKDRSDVRVIYDKRTTNSKELLSLLDKLSFTATVAG